MRGFFKTQKGEWYHIATDARQGIVERTAFCNSPQLTYNGTLVYAVPENMICAKCKGKYARLSKLNKLPEGINI